MEEMFWLIANGSEVRENSAFVGFSWCWSMATAMSEISRVVCHVSVPAHHYVLDPMPTEWRKI